MEYDYATIWDLDDTAIYTTKNGYRQKMIGVLKEVLSEMSSYDFTQLSDSEMMGLIGPEYMDTLKRLEKYGLYDFKSAMKNRL